jgi:sec-independent protein translocase protein TatC
MTFLEHLDELRRRIIYSLYAVLACMVPAFYFWDTMYDYLTKYFQHNGGTLIYTRPTAGFMFSMKISFIAALLLASPFVFAQLWFFIAPGLYRREKKLVIPFVLASTTLFLSGAAFGHFVAYPAMWKFFASFQRNGVQFFPTIDETFSFYWKMLGGLGVAFELPILVFVLARFGIVDARFLARNTKYAILIIFIIAAVLTPTPDPVNQTIFALPMLALYGISIGVAWAFGKKRTKES